MTVAAPVRCCGAAQVLVALITIDVHNRDIVEQLAVDKVASKQEFGWQMQLRYEYDAEADQVHVCQVQARFSYGYEYLGAQPRLVVTPMTDRCGRATLGASAAPTRAPAPGAC